MRGEHELGYVEVEVLGDTSVQLTASSGWADIGNLWVEPVHRRNGVGRWLLAQAVDWLDLAGVSRLLSYTGLEGDEEEPFLTAVGFRRLTSVQGGLSLP